MMNLPVIFSNVSSLFKGAVSTCTFFARKHAPEIMISTGLAGFGLTIVETVKATNKTNDILECRDRDLHDTVVTYDSADGPDLTERELTDEEKAIIKRDARIGLIKTWAPVATTALASTALIIGGYRVINGRYVATALAYKTLEAGYERYRSNVVKEFGKDTDWRMANNLSQEEFEKIKAERRDNQQIAEDNQNKKKKDRKPYKKACEQERKYLFDEYSRYWKRWWTPDQFLQYIRSKTNQLQDKFELQGYLFVNDVLDAFGMEKTSEGQVVGWIKKRGVRTIISVGLDEMPADEIERILATRDNSNLRFWLKMNPDGIIWNELDNIKDAYLYE